MENEPSSDWRMNSDMRYLVEPTLITIADLKQHLEQFDDDAMIVFRADTEREPYDDSALIDMRERLTFEPVSLMLANDVDYWETDDGVSDRFRMKALGWKEN